MVGAAKSSSIYSRLKNPVYTSCARRILSKVTQWNYGSRFKDDMIRKRELASWTNPLHIQLVTPPRGAKVHVGSTASGMPRPCPKYLLWGRKWLRGQLMPAETTQEIGLCSHCSARFWRRSRFPSSFARLRAILLQCLKLRRKLHGGLKLHSAGSLRSFDARDDHAICSATSCPPQNHWCAYTNGRWSTGRSLKVNMRVCTVFISICLASLSVVVVYV